MRGAPPAAAIALGCLLACGGLAPREPAPSEPAPALPGLWTPPPAPADPMALRIEPSRLVLRLGESGVLALRGALARRADCEGTADGAAASRLAVPAAAEPGVLEIRCGAGAAEARAQVTYTAASRLPLPDPYAGGVVLAKARRSPRLAGPVGTRETGLPELDALLRGLGGFAFPAFPFGRSGSVDRVGLRRWLALEIPEGVNFYQAVALLRGARRDLYPESYLPEDGTFLRVAAAPGWPTPLTGPRPRTAEGAAGLQPVGRGGSAAARGTAGWELERIGAPEAWSRATGRGVGIAVVDSGVDLNHLAVSGSLRLKPGEGLPSADGDGNGIPGDERGVNFAHLAIASGGARSFLALGLAAALADWDGIDARGRGRLGHGTAVAALAAGPVRPGVAPGAWLLPVDVQEDLRIGGAEAEDPRMRAAPVAERGPRRAGDALRSSAWGRAAGVAYAVGEGAGVVTCAWRDVEPSWLLHDALVFAEDNCTVAVCAEGEGYPAGWIHPGVRPGERSGDVLDAWTGELLRDFALRPLRGAVLAGVEGSRTDADVRVPARAEGGARVQSAISAPRSKTPHSLSGPAPDDAVAVGMVAGAVAVLREWRPDLEPAVLRAALREAADASGTLDLPASLERLEGLPPGGCSSLEVRLRRQEDEARPWWKRIKVDVHYEPLKGDAPVEPVDPPPAEPDPEPGRRR